MKQLILILTALLCFSCSKSNTTSSDSEGGKVVFNAAVESVVMELTKASSTSELPADLIPSIEEFALNVTGSYIDPEDNVEKDYSYTYSSIYEQNEKSPYLTEGNYNAAISYGEVNSEGEEKPFFAGNTDFTIIARDIIECSISAALTNSAIELTTTEWFNKYYTSATFVVTTSLGNSFTFTTEEDSPLIFVNAGTTLTLSGSAVKTTGTSVEFPAAVIGTTSAQTKYTISIDASEASAAENITINFDETTTNIPIEVELNPEA